MARRKVKLAFIANDSARKASFRKRKSGLIKKIKELSTLCDVTACAIIYGPYDSQPELWPQTVPEVKSVLEKFRGMPQMSQRKKMVDQERFLRQQIVKVGEQLKKQRRDNRDKEVSTVMFRILSGMTGFHGMDVPELGELGAKIDQTLAEMNQKRERLLNKEPVGPENGSTVALVPPQHKAVDGLMVQSMQRQPWFINLANPPQPQVMIGDYSGGGSNGCDKVTLPMLGDYINPNNFYWSSSNSFFH